MVVSRGEAPGRGSLADRGRAKRCVRPTRNVDVFETPQRADFTDGSSTTDSDRQSRPDESERAADGGLLARRVVAFLLDTGLVAGACAAVASAINRRRRAGLTTLLAATVGFVYHVVLEGRTGQTAGKRAAGIAVVRSDGRPCSYTAATLRTGGRFVDALPIGYLVGIAAILLTDRDQRLGDLLADTEVVRTAERDARGDRADG